MASKKKYRLIQLLLKTLVVKKIDPQSEEFKSVNRKLEKDLKKTQEFQKIASAAGNTRFNT